MNELNRLLATVPVASLSELGGKAEQLWTTAADCGDAVLAVLQSLVTAQCTKLVQGLQLRGLARHVDDLCRLKRSGMLLVESVGQSNDTPFIMVLERVFLDALRDRFPSPSEQITSLQCLRPPASTFGQLNFNGLLRSAGIIDWFTSCVLVVLRAARMPSSFLCQLTVANQLGAEGAVDGMAVSLLARERLKIYVKKEGASLPKADLKHLQEQVMGCLAPFERHK